MRSDALRCDATRQDEDPDRPREVAALLNIMMCLDGWIKRMDGALLANGRAAAPRRGDAR